MSQEAAPERAVPEQSAPPSVPQQKDAGAPKGLLQQMEELMAALSADLSQLDADIQSTADRLDPEPTRPGAERDHSEREGSDPLGIDRRGTEGQGPENHGSQHDDTEHRENTGHGPDHRPATGGPRPLF
ncbi:hypothetical protein [Streptomyces gardneri]|uniref:hypothetical protein n=1 Tax=Streptomyces gardneri TaxID=66892 RepID=UPI0036CBCE7B